MGLFNFFKFKSNKQNQENSQEHSLIIQGPKYLRKFLTDPRLNITKIRNPKIEYVGQLISSAGNTFFSLKYFGNVLVNETIASTDKMVNKVVAIDITTKEEILLFDKAFHGYDGFIAEAYLEQRYSHRPATLQYVSKRNSEKFQIIIKAYYNYGTREGLIDFANQQGQIEFDNGTHLDLQDAFDDSFDGLSIFAIDESGNKFQIIDEELA